ncbi:hypothetical protein BBM03_07910 [Vibrio parahaemolyticus]|uniref:hypothetical protein n=1 Tax=Vibrio harveyi group TaxID=717610 RepID=UPI00084B41D9|nr:hypothetical protein [Vibrio parahaemolyticus]MBT0087039.1 hypothetical protein [Vibrio alginolyticus]ODX36980.1 hypothetical protein BBM03_07910 [Vibrio parahaemolyticus]
MSLEEIKARLLTASETAESLLAQVYDLYVQSLQSEETLLVEALTDLHNSGDINLIKLMGHLDKRTFRHDIYSILQVFESTLPSLNTNVKDVLHCLVYLNQQVDSGGLFGAFERFCCMEKERPRISINVIMSQSELDQYAPFISSSILAYELKHVADAIHMTKNLIAHKNKTIRSQAYFALGRLNVDDAHAKLIWKMLSESANVEHDGECKATLLSATFHFGEKFPSYWAQIGDFLAAFVEKGCPEVTYKISSILAFQKVELPNDILHLMIKPLFSISPEQNGTIRNIDYVLVRLIEKHSSSIAIELLESILALDIRITELGYFSRKLLSDQQDLLNHIVTRWFLSGEVSLCRSTLEILQTITSKDIKLKADLALIDDDVKQVFASHKAVGWWFTHPITAASFILSIYEAASITSRKELERILYDPLLLSYPGDLERFFQSCMKEGIQESLCRNLLGKLDTYHADIERVSGLKELMAPNENLNAFWKDANKEMETAYEKASKFSILQDIATTQTLLYGNSSIYYLRQGDGTRVRQEMPMQSFSHSTEMPRLNVLDPESLDYALRVYRCERMKDEVNS